MRIRFRLKQGCGSHRYLDAEGALIVMRPGDVIKCDPDDVKSLMFKFEQIDPDPPQPVPVAGLRMERASDETNQWNVINEATGKPINDVPLNHRDAQGLVRDTKVQMSQEEVATE